MLASQYLLQLPIELPPNERDWLPEEREGVLEEMEGALDGAGGVLIVVPRCRRNLENIGERCDILDIVSLDG